MYPHLRQARPCSRAVAVFAVIGLTVAMIVVAIASTAGDEVSTDAGAVSGDAVAMLLTASGGAEPDRG